MNSEVTGSSSSRTNPSNEDNGIAALEKKKLKIVYELLQEILQEIYKFLYTENRHERLKTRLLDLIDKKMEEYLDDGGLNTLVETFIQDEYTIIAQTIQEAVEDWIDARLPYRVNRSMVHATNEIMDELMKSTDTGRIIFREARERIRTRRNVSLMQRIEHLENQISNLNECVGRLSEKKV